MKLEPVTSSAISAIGYDASAHELGIRYVGGGEYCYEDVPQRVHAELMAASSKGTYVNSRIKNAYRFRRLHQRQGQNP
jgi:hypothetical protein